ncbi:MAG: ATP-dependent Clp protease ATP-binding subunit [Planctomycetes bacterium]|nr:ATP-dependent Clp protease ATP-binding subunit [Planctomycetota bacterium]
MIRVQSNVVLKYVEPLDRFVKIRIFPPAEIGSLLQIHRPLGKEEYYQLVMSACLVDYRQDAPADPTRAHSRERELEEALYQACVECNPGLDIKKVVLPVTDRAEGTSELHLIESEAVGSPRSGLDRIGAGGLEENLRSRVIGQNEPIRAVVRALRGAAAGLRRSSRPVGSFLFVGQTGVGKTELARALARAVWGDVGHLLRIDCSEYALRHEYSKLIGAPPGYVGYGEGGLLTEGMRRLGEAVIVFDEVEKADPQVHNLLLQLLEEGVVTDGKGTPIPFHRALVVLTSNLGADRVEALSQRIGFMDVGSPDRRERFLETVSALKEIFRPEFLNRLDEVILFNPLDLPACVEIVGLVLGELRANLGGRGIGFEVTPPAQKHLAEVSYAPEYGAREIRRVVQREVEEPLAEMILGGRVGAGKTVRVKLRSRRLGFEVN